MTTHQIWSCHVTQVANSENFQLWSSSELTLGKVTKFLVQKLYTSDVISQKPQGGGKHPLPVPSGLSMFEYMLQSRESSWDSDLLSEFITGKCKKIPCRANKNEIKCFEFGSIKRALRPHLRTIIAGLISVYIDLLPPIGRHDNFIKISYCIFKIHKPSIKFFHEK